MSYDIYLQYPNGDEVSVPRHAEGGTYTVGGTHSAHLNITYNYGCFYYEYIDPDKGIRWLYGKSGAETVEVLEQTVKALGTVRDENYWATTAGNAGYSLNILLSWARLHPDAVWDGD